jgi:ABC-type Mn2+/Zn2+ transport system ATPase subunit
MYICNKRIWVSDCLMIRVGDESLRGVSGGEKKRVTTAEVLCGPAMVLCMDEVSTGLDSGVCVCVYIYIYIYIYIGFVHG